VLRVGARVRSLSADQVSFMVRGFMEHDTKEGENIIVQGEAGDHFYLVGSGKYQVTRLPVANLWLAHPPARTTHRLLTRHKDALRTHTQRMRRPHGGRRPSHLSPLCSRVHMWSRRTPRTRRSWRPPLVLLTCASLLRPSAAPQATLTQLDEKTVAEYGVGDSFGELALLYNSPRAATVTCTGKGVVWALERRRFRHVMVHAAANLNTTKADLFLKSVPMLSTLTDAQRVRLGDAMEVLTYGDGEYVVSMGEIADALFFIKSGECVCHQGDTKGDMLRMSTGQVFGESCLEPTADDAVRKANVVAVGPVAVLKLTAQAFKEQVGNLNDLISRNFKRKVLESVEIETVKLFDGVSDAHNAHERTRATCTACTAVHACAHCADPHHRERARASDGSFRRRVSSPPPHRQVSTEQQELLLNEMQEVSLPSGSVCIDQGSNNSTFYVIKSGNARVTQATSDGGVVKELAVLTAGTFFGERALLLDEPAAATIKAAEDGPLVCYTIGRATFGSVLGSMRDLLDQVVKRREEDAKRPKPPKWADLELRRILGVGTFGRVKLVKHTPSQQTFALKCIRKAQVVATKQQTHVLNEKRILAMMDHPFVLKLVATYQDKGELYILMELALGGELFTMLAKHAPLSDAHAKFYVSNVVSMFSYTHGHSIVYRDLKPENLLLDSTGYLKLVDFGFAKVLNDRTYTLCGTPEYLAPEIILNKGHSFSVDWWCVGILAFELLTGVTPFVANDPMEVRRRIPDPDTHCPHDLRWSAYIPWLAHIRLAAVPPVCSHAGGHATHPRLRSCAASLVRGTARSSSAACRGHQPSRPWRATLSTGCSTSPPRSGSDRSRAVRGTCARTPGSTASTSIS
jgi:CRP-like cAMP-binding protein